MSLLDVVARMIEAALDNYKPPASRIRDQLSGSQVAPASSGSPGVVDPDAFEPAAGTPATDDSVYTSATAGTRAWKTLAAIVHAATAKTGLADNDELLLADSAASYALKRITWGSVRAVLDALYAPLSHSHSYVSSVSGTAPIVSSGGTTPAISISAATTGAAGSMSAADKTKSDAYPAVSGLTAGQVLRATGASAIGFGAVDLADPDAITGDLPDANLSSNVPLKDAVNAFSENMQIGTAADVGFRLDVESLAAYATARFTRNSTATNTAANVYGVRIKTTADMVNGFGGGFFFQIEDDTAGPNVIATIRAIRDGSDTSGAIVFLVNSAGNEAARLNTDRSLTIAQYLEMTEMTAPAAAAANGGRLFLRDNGSGKTQLCIIFNTGAVQVIAQQP